MREADEAARRIAAGELSARLPEPATGASERRVRARLGDGHQAPQAEPRQRSDCVRERRRRRGRRSALRRLAAHVHLHADLQGRQARGPLHRETLRDLQAIDRVHPVEALRDRARLVALERSDEVPDEVALVERGELGERLLEVVFAEVALPGRVRVTVLAGGVSHEDEPAVTARPLGAR